MQEPHDNKNHGVKREPTSVGTLASKKPRNLVYSDPILASSPLLQAVLIDDVQGVKSALDKKSDYDYVYAEIVDGSFGKSLNALDIAIVRGCFHNVQLIVDLNFDITHQYSTLSGRGRSNNPFVLAATYYKKDIFDYLIKKFNDQLTHGFIVVSSGSRTPNLFRLQDALNTILKTVEILPLEAIDLLQKQGVDPFGESSLEVLFNVREFSDDVSFSAYIQKFGPDLCINACIRDRRVADLNQLETLGHKMTVKDRSGHTPYQAMSDKKKDHTLPWTPAFSLSVKTTEKRKERFKPWNERTQQIFEIILKNQIHPCYEDFIYAAQQNTEVLSIMLNWASNALNPILTLSQYVEIFNTMLAHQSFHSVQQEIFYLLSEKYVDLYKQIDKDLNNILHVVANVDKKLNPTLFLNFFEKYLRTKYPLQANDILRDLMSSKNKDDKFPDEFDIKSDAVRKKLENWKAYRNARVPFIAPLLDVGCDIFLKQDNPYAKALFVLAPNEEILNALKHRSELLNAKPKKREITRVLEK